MAVETRELSPGRQTGASRRPWHARPLVFVVAGVLLVGGATGAGYAWWRSSQPTFCSEAAALPDLTGPVQQDATPAAALQSDARALDRLADLAPEVETAAAARTLAETQRALADHLTGDPTEAHSIEAIARIDGAQVDAARSTLDHAITTHCT